VSNVLLRPTAALIKFAALCVRIVARRPRPPARSWLREAPARVRPSALRQPPVWLLLAALYLPLAGTAGDTGEPLLPLLQGEFALQRGDYAEAAQAYLDAAGSSRDPAVAERAARLALLANDEAAASRALERWQQLAPASVELHSVQAMLAVRRGDTEAAISALDGLLDQPGGWKLAVQVLAAPDHGLSGAAVLAALLDSPKLPSALEPLLAFGELALRLELFGLAASTAGRATADHPESPRAWLLQAEVEREQSRPEAARAALDAALALPGLDGGARLAIAAGFDALGDPQAAAKVLAEAEQDDATRAGRAAYLARADAPDQLAALYAEIREAAPRSAAGSLLLGQLAELMGDLAAALAWYDEVPPGSSREHARLRVAVLHSRQDRLDDALATLRSLQSSHSENGAALIDAYLLEAELLRKDGKADAALEALQRGLAVFEDEPGLLYARALAFERADQVDAALADLRRLVELEPDSADALNALGYTLADRTSHYQEAYELIRRALEIKPDSAAIMDSMGWVLHKLGRSSEGLEYLQRAFELQPDAEVAAHIGEVLWLLGQRDEAREVWARGSEIDADNRALRETIQRFGP
jgi:tetratricopeptide (TPR) repeat protein